VQIEIKMLQRKMHPQIVAGALIYQLIAMCMSGAKNKEAIFTLPFAMLLLLQLLLYTHDASILYRGWQ